MLRKMAQWKQGQNDVSCVLVAPLERYFLGPKKVTQTFFPIIQKGEGRNSNNARMINFFFGGGVCSKGRSRRQTTQRNKREPLSNHRIWEKGKSFFWLPCPASDSLFPEKKGPFKSDPGKKRKDIYSFGKTGINSGGRRGIKNVHNRGSSCCCWAVFLKISPFFFCPLIFAFAE